MNFFKLYIGDYQRDTAHLSLAENGAYLLMLQHHYATEKPLPTDKALYRLLRADGPADREAIDSVVKQFWRLTPQGLVNDRAHDEITKASTQAATNRRIAVQREAARKGHEPTTNRSTINQPIQTPDTRHQTPEPEPEHDAREPQQAAQDWEQAQADRYALLQRIMAVYPAGMYRQVNWGMAEREIGFRLDEGADPVELEQAATEYAVQQSAIGKVGSQFVLSPHKFFGNEGHWRGPFALPPAPAGNTSTAARSSYVPEA